MESIVINVPFTFEQEVLDDIVCSAFDGDYGGCNYWASVNSVDESNKTEEFKFATDAITRGCVYILEDIESEDTRTLRFGIDELIKGITLYLHGVDHNLETKLPLECVDAIHADVIVQLGLFGKVIYG